MTSIYLDHAASTPMDPLVRTAMLRREDVLFGNPSSGHRLGRAARRALEEARERLAAAVRAHPDHVVFVRGGTEGDNLALLGAIDAARAHGTPASLAYTAVEHSAVRVCAEAIQTDGVPAHVVGVAPDGALDHDRLDTLLAGGLTVLSAMWVNNETGVVLPIPELARRTRSHGTLLHVDAVQAVGKIPVDLSEVPVDLLVLTGHKLGGPRGVGALIKNPDAPLAPVLFGGGQEGGLRPGTEDVVGALGLAAAVEIAVEQLPSAAKRWSALRTRLEQALTRTLPGLVVHSAEGERAPHIANVGIPDIDRDTLLAGLDGAGLAVSGGSACSSGASRQSRVLKAMYGDDYTAAALRYSVGKTTTVQEIDRAVDITASVVARLRTGASAKDPAVIPTVP